MSTIQNPTPAHYMHRALELAALGIGTVSPNPMVGCVIVHNHRIIGEGWHQRYGSGHAEVNALASVAEIDLPLLPESTVYVTLEPCSHTGKTPPCADLLIEKRVGKVVIAALDSNPLVSGNGIRKLQAAGITVETGLLATQARWQNRRFFTYMEKKRPYILLKWAQTADRFIARQDYSSKWISHTLARTLVHKWRSEEASVLVGTHTAHYDNPRLNVRDWTGSNPIRIVVDRQLRLSPLLHLFDQTQTTLCYNLHTNESHNHVQYIRCQADTFLEEMMDDLFQRKIQSVLIEGGSTLLQQFIDHQLWDEARIITAPHSFGKGIQAPNAGGRLSETMPLGPDTLSVFFPL